MKDFLRSRKDMESLGIGRDLWLYTLCNNSDAFHVPSAPFILNARERMKVLDIIKNLKTSSNHVGAIYKCVEEGKLRYLKSDDFYMMM